MSKFRETYKKLNQSQKLAVDTIDGPLLVVAGPGTGKTTLLTARIANILEKTDINPSNILALTFTESGVRAMKTKLIDLIGSPAYFVNINTFHSFASGIIQEYSEKFDEAMDLKPLSDLERIQVFRQILEENDFDKLKNFRFPLNYLNSIKQAISDLKREGIDIDEFEKLIRQEEKELNALQVLQKEKRRQKTKIDKLETQIIKHHDLLKIYKEYQKKISEIGRYDYEDMISFVLNRLKIDEAFRLELQEKYQYILIDEYQDTNTAQNELILELASYWGEEANVFAVGDDEQAIYRFQGASLENILTFKTAFPKANIIVLDTNYRSVQNIIDNSRELISKNTQNIINYIPDLIKDYKSNEGVDGDKIKVAEFKHGAVENYYIAMQIKKNIEEGVNAENIAIIVRENKDIDDLESLFDRLHIKYDSVSGGNILEDGMINQLLTLFSLINEISSNGEENPELYFTVLNYDFLKLNYFDVLKLSFLANEFGGYKKTLLKLEKFIKNKDAKSDKLAVIKENNNKLGFDIIENPEAIIEIFQKLSKWASDSKNMVFSRFFEIVINESGYLEHALNSEDKIDHLSKLNTLFDEIKKLNDSDKNLDLASFVNSINLMKENNLIFAEREIGKSEKGVKLMTAHRAKGLEFDFVYIAKAIDGKWGKKPDRNKIKLPDGIIKYSKTDVDLQIEDERRLFFVALTRAKFGVTICYSERYGDSNSSSNIPALFVTELKQDLVEKVDADKFTNDNRIQIDQSILFNYKSKVSDQEEKEAEFINYLISKFKLSVTALNTYLECGYKFKLNNLFRVPRAKSISLTFGNAVHLALRKYFEKYKSSNSAPSIEVVYSYYKEALKKQILTEKQYKDMEKEGIAVLKKYYEKYINNFNVPLYMEFGFGRFPHNAVFEDIELRGIVDKIELLDPAQKSVRVVDYKTGQSKSENEVLGKTKNSDLKYFRQLMFYKLLAELDPNFNLSVVEAELDFVEHLKKVRINYKDYDTKDLKKEIRESMKNIREHNFLRTTDHKICEKCDFKNHCWPGGVPKR